MDNQRQFRPPLEPIEEESEQEEDEIQERKTEGEGEDFHIGVGVETKEMVAEDESEDDEEDAVPLRVMRTRRLYCSLRQESFLQNQSANNHQEEKGNFSEPDRSTHGVDLSDEASTPLQTRLRNETRFSSGKLRIKVSKIRWQKQTSPKQTVQKKTINKGEKEAPLVKELFPEWLVHLMINIEEAKTHQLVME